MKNIDWSKAPEGAEYWRKSLERWYRVNGEYAYVFSAYSGRWDRSQEFNAQTIESHKDFVKRQCNASWNGIGLPPVGTVCEHQGKADDNEWLRVKILAHTVSYSQDVAVFQYDDTVSFSSARYFRPIRTTEQIAAEEREKAIDAMNKLVGDIEKIPTWRDALAALYDAGYRKTEAVK